MSKQNSIEEKMKLWIMKFVSNYWLFGILLFLIGVDISCHFSRCVVSHESIVLTFIGILATFIVVSNYAQVKDLERKLDELRNQTTNKLEYFENMHIEILQAFIDSNTLKINGFEKDYHSYKNEEEKEITLFKLIEYKVIENLKIKELAFETFCRLICSRNGVKINCNLTDIFHSGVTSFFAYQMTKADFTTIGKIAINSSFDLVYSIIFHSKKIVPTVYALLSVKYIYVIARKENNDEILKAIEESYQRITSSLKERSLSEFKDATELIKEMKNGLNNRNLGWPDFKNKELYDRLERELKEDEN